MFGVRKDVSLSGLVTTDQVAAVFALDTVGQIRPGVDGKYPGDKVQEPIGGCQVAVVLSLLRNRIYPVSRAGWGQVLCIRKVVMVVVIAVFCVCMGVCVCLVR